MEVGALGSRPARPLELYDFEGCPYCRKVREALSMLDLDAIVYPCPKGATMHRAAVERLTRAFALRDELRSIATPDTIVCRCEDVRLGDVDSADGFRRARVHARLGMGPCQGRICGDAMSFLKRWDPEGARTPVTPVPLAAFGSQTASSSFDHSPAGA